MVARTTPGRPTDYRFAKLFLRVVGALRARPAGFEQEQRDQGDLDSFGCVSDGGAVSEQDPEQDGERRVPDQYPAHDVPVARYLWNRKAQCSQQCQVPETVQHKPQVRKVERQVDKRRAEGESDDTDPEYEVCRRARRRHEITLPVLVAYEKCTARGHPAVPKQPLLPTEPAPPGGCLPSRAPERRGGRR